MAHDVWFEVDLDCALCGGRTGDEARLHVPGLNPDYRDRRARPGDNLDSTLDDFEDAFHRLRDPEGDEITALEQWSCPGSDVGWARLRFRSVGEGVRFLGAEASELSREALVEVHFLSRRIDLWVEANPGSTADIRDLVEPFLPGKGSP